MCQLQFIDEIEQKNSWLNDKLQFSIRKFRWYKRIIFRNRYSANSMSKISRVDPDQIRLGDMVRVRSETEIRQTLDGLRKTRGCTFQTEMFNHCGKEYRVFKEVGYFFDESKQKICKCNDIFLLEGSYCNGKTAYLHPCNRNCFYFWQTSWLEKV